MVDQREVLLKKTKIHGLDWRSIEKKSNKKPSVKLLCGMGCGSMEKGIS